MMTVYVLILWLTAGPVQMIFPSYADCEQAREIAEDLYSDQGKTFRGDRFHVPRIGLCEKKIMRRTL